MENKNALVYKVGKYGKAISDTNRVLILKMLGSLPEDTVKVGDIAQYLHISQPAATKHLQILHDVNLISRKKVGSTVYYSVNKDTLNDFEQLMKYCFERVSHPCEYQFDCDHCPNAETCI